MDLSSLPASELEGSELGGDAAPGDEKVLCVVLGDDQGTKKPLEMRSRNEKASILDAEVSKNDHCESCVNEIPTLTVMRRGYGVTGWYKPQRSMTLQEQGGWGKRLKAVARRSTPSPEVQQILEKMYGSLKQAAERGVCSEESSPLRRCREGSLGRS